MTDAVKILTAGDYVRYQDGHVGRVVAVEPHSWVTAVVLSTAEPMQRRSQVALYDFGVTKSDAEQFVRDMRNMVDEVGHFDCGLEKPLTLAEWSLLNTWCEHPSVGGEVSLIRTPVLEGMFHAAAVGRFDGRPHALGIMYFLVFGEPYRFRTVRS